MGIDGMPAKAYLGDGVYAAFDQVRGCLVLTTEDGIRATNTIYFEPDVLEALALYARRVRESLDADAANGDAG